MASEDPTTPQDAKQPSTLRGGAVHARLIAALNDGGVSFRLIHHEPVYTSAEAAAVRGTPMHSGAKALIMKGAKDFVMVVLPADMALDSNALRKHLRVKRLRFATREEVGELTGGLTPGSIPPFGSLFGLPVVCDERLADNAWINFNAASHTDSVQLAYDAYVRYESPEIVRVAKDAPSDQED